MTYHEQQQSKLPKKGETLSHLKAKRKLCNILIDLGYEIFPDAPMVVSFDLWSKNQELLASNRAIYRGENHTYYHEFDVYARKEHSNGLKSEIVIEIDGKIHGSKPQKNRDKTAERYASFFLPEAKFKRIPISELLTDQDDKLIVDFYGLK